MIPAREKLLAGRRASPRTEPALIRRSALAVPAHGHVAATVLTRAGGQRWRGASVHNHCPAIDGQGDPSRSRRMAALAGKASGGGSGELTGQPEGLSSVAHDVRPVRGQLSVI